MPRFDIPERLELFLSKIPARIVMLELLPRLAPNSLVADIGSGHGRNTLPLLEAGHRVVAVERLAEELDKVVQQANQAQKKDALMCVPKRLEEFTCPEGTLDGVCFINVLHFFSPEKVAEELKRYQVMTKPGGYHAIVSFTSGSDPEAIQRMKIIPQTADQYHALYPDWEFVDEKVLPGPTCLKDDNGQAYKCEMLNLLIRKPL